MRSLSRMAAAPRQLGRRWATAARAKGEREAQSLPAARRLRFGMTIAALERFGTGAGRIKVLDAGCGDGLLAEALARRHPDWEIVGVDLDEARLEVARRRVRGGGLGNLRLEQADLTGAGGLDAEFDVVLAIECLVEIEDDDRALASMAGALRPGGLFIAHVPARDWSPVLATSERTWRHEVRHGYDVQELSSKLERAGLVMTEARPCSHALVRVAQEIRDRTKRRGLKVALVVHLVALVAVALEQRGLRLGRPRAWFVQAVRR